MNHPVPAEYLTRPWHTSSYSQNNAACVEIAATDEAVLVRDTKNRSAGHITVAPSTWATFTTQLKAGLYSQ